MSTGWEWVERGLGIARARMRMAALARESPEDIKYCPVCGEYILLPEDEAVHGPMNLVYHVICPVCADTHPDAYMELKKAQDALEGLGAE